MGCAGCAVKTVGSEKVSGCNGCSSGGCNRLNTFDWLSDIPFSFGNSNNLYEISFNKGSRKEFFRTKGEQLYEKGDIVIVGTKTGQDLGTVSLRGELVKVQMRKKRSREKEDELPLIKRLANQEDLEKYAKIKEKEQPTMIRSRVIARDLGLEMKIGQVEYQQDGKKATFFYIADGRVDFRELIKKYAAEFKVKIEMRQIGARQEAGKIGGLGSCGRELCCSTWLTNFKSVNTSAARYQNISININKLSGQCGRLKCCLNYELDTYIDALAYFPKKADYLSLAQGSAKLIKTDIFKGIMYYQRKDSNKLTALEVERVKEILVMNKKGEKPETLLSNEALMALEAQTDPVFEDGSGDLTLETIERTAKRRKRRESKKRKYSNRKKSGNNTQGNQRSNSGGKNSNSNQAKKSGRNQKSNSNQSKNTNQNKNSNQSKNTNQKSNNTNQNQNKQQKQSNSKQQNSKTQNQQKPSSSNAKKKKYYPRKKKS